ncbi:rubrerythrin [Geothermobacter ehrlichii]|uniref:Rubrerythrin n=1 Tax=Geothermobacter ehrlichii TaxID=213224 RepID=A0A5D3WMB5_9BACT|nr:ferritin family protein [Geothermobacter ehrlichii]TYO99990.1 rubrerythrin [Geothermobacter ehrlichii]
MRGFLEDCRQIELTVSRIYQHLAGRQGFPATYRQMFLTLAKDEGDHARQFDLALQLPDGMLGERRRLSGEKACEGLLTVRRRLQDLLQTECSLRQALELAVELERRFIRVHIDTSLVIDDPKISDLFRKLARSEQEHLATLRRHVELWNSEH